MGNKKTRRPGGPARFEPGASYDEVGPDLGVLREAWQVDTGQAALEFQPTDRVEWTPSGDYTLRVLCQREPVTLRLLVDGPPPGVPSDELSDIFMWLRSALQRVEKNPRVSAHLAPTLPTPRVSWSPRASAVLALMTGLLCFHVKRAPELPALEVACALRPADVAPDNPSMTDTEAQLSEIIAYPLPDTPFRNQAAAPCKPDLGEEEISGGCWLALDKKPPCLKVHAEYQGKCYIPVSKGRGRPPTSVEP